MRELSLFTGAGGGLLGTKLLGWNTVGYVEINDYCQRVIAQRIKDGILDEAPIFGDIRSFISEGFAESYQGMVDVVTGGFPCQPFSTAGKGLSDKDSRNMWPQTIEVIRKIRPKYVFLENVSNLRNKPYIRRIFGDLAESGFDVRWCVLGASDIGANHHRKRIWIIANSSQVRCETGQSFWERIQRKLKTCNEINPSLDASDYHSKRIQRFWQEAICGKPRISGSKNGGGFEEFGRRRDLFEPKLCRTFHGIPFGVDRIEAIGNAQFPALVKAVWRLLGPK